MQEDKEAAIKLTRYSRGAGCGCKIAPAVLEEILKGEERENHFPALIVGNGTNDDAAVFDRGDGTAIISTTDFFMPIVDDAYDFGRIAAANAISDVYAMGGKPLMAIAILGWPISTLPATLASRVLDGARSICREANIPLAGGHTIDSAEPLFGLAVTGVVSPANLKKNSGAQVGDILFLTKPLGTGILSTAQKREALEEAYYPSFINNMTLLNNIGEKLGSITSVSAMTDVTGFGFAGHLIEMMDAANLTAEIEYSKLPTLPGTTDYINRRIIPDATFRNWNSYGKKVSFDKGVNVLEAFSLLPDPQTNGGLLISVRPEARDLVSKILLEAGLNCTPVGRVVDKEEKPIRIKP
jgi:selenide,water dikinase